MWSLPHSHAKALLTFASPNHTMNISHEKKKQPKKAQQCWEGILPVYKIIRYKISSQYVSILYGLCITQHSLLLLCRSNPVWVEARAVYLGHNTVLQSSCALIHPDSILELKRVAKSKQTKWCIWELALSQKLWYQWRYPSTKMMMMGIYGICGLFWIPLFVEEKKEGYWKVGWVKGSHCKLS